MTNKDSEPVRVTRDGNTLVAVYPSATPPLVWKFDLDRNHSFTLALQGEDGDWKLGVNSPREEFHPVARFRSRDDAEEAFERTQNGLLKKKSTMWRTLTLLSLGVIVVLVVFIIVPLIHLAGQRIGPKLGSAAASSSSPPYVSPFGAAQPPPAELKEGEPMPADQVLKPPS